MKALGTHIVVDYTMDKDHPLLNNPDTFLEFMRNACIHVGATVLQQHAHPFGEGFGYTAFLLLSESHASIHTWPEYGKATLDIFMCGDCNPIEALGYFADQFDGLTQTNYSVMWRG